MKKTCFVLLMLIGLLQLAYAAEPPELADERLVSTLLPGYTFVTVLS